MYAHDIRDVQSDPHTDYDQLVEAGLLIPEEELLRMQRPLRCDFQDDVAEYFRWHEWGGNVRSQPLDYDELVAFMIDVYGYSQQEANEKVSRESCARRGDKALWRRIAERDLKRALVHT